MENSNGGMGIVSVLTIIFIVLKLCNVITWSWLWVLSPIWISLALAATVIVPFIIVKILKGRKR